MKYTTSLLIRYILVFLPLGFLYYLLTPITIYLVRFCLYFWNPIVIGNLMVINGIPFTFIDACIAVYAYWLILFLALSVKDLEIIKRLKIIFFGFILILLMNVFRIVLLIFITVDYGFAAFNLIHLFFWKFVSWIYVALLWIIMTKYYNVKSIPVYSDYKYLIKLIRKHKN